jgi:uncharacterized protein (TIGR00369 family)
MNDTTTNALSIPEGFEEMDPYGPFHIACGPMYFLARGDLTVVGLGVLEKHRNKGQIMHGGMLMMLVDTAMTKACGRLRREDEFFVTSNLTTELMAAVRPGDWIEAEVEVLRRGRKVMFLDCRVRRDGPGGQLVAHASGTFQVVAAT